MFIDRIPWNDIIAWCFQVKGPTDFSNFDSYPKDMDIPPDESSGWDADF